MAHAEVAAGNKAASSAGNYRNNRGMRTHLAYRLSAIMFSFTFTTAAADCDTDTSSAQSPLPVMKTVSFTANLELLPFTAVIVPTADIPAMPVVFALYETPLI